MVKPPEEKRSKEPSTSSPQLLISAEDLVGDGADSLAAAQTGDASAVAAAAAAAAQDLEPQGAAGVEGTDAPAPNGRLLKSGLERSMNLRRADNSVIERIVGSYLQEPEGGHIGRRRSVDAGKRRSVEKEGGSPDGAAQGPEEGQEREGAAPSQCMPQLSRSDVEALATMHEEVSILFTDIKV